MKPRLSGLAIQTLAVVYTFAGFYIGCGSTSSGDKGPVIPKASSSKPKKTENNGLTKDDDADGTKEKRRKNSKEDDDIGDDPENDEEESDENDNKDQENGSQSDSSSKEGNSRKPSFCDKKFVDLSSKDQALIRKNVNRRLDDDDLQNMRITNCKLDKNGDLTFDYDFGRRNRDN